MAHDVEHRLRLSGDPAALETLNAAVEAFAEAAGLGARQTHDLNLVLEELFTNTVTHGYGPDEVGWVGIVLRSSGGGVQLELSDGGRAFDPLAHPDPPPPAALDEAPIGGLGVALVRRLTRGGRYRRVAGENHLTLELRPPPS
ncbi:ATP-binding protein [Methylobacterium aquaticum]|uniref:ATP-binding protein n=1 Tax=Methylobacterium aquaticum TaxID=270351 RepID=UPI003D186B1B